MSFLGVLDKLLSLLQVWYAKREQDKFQKEQDELEASPANWFEHHFDGMPALPTNQETAKTNISDTETK